jgi:ADP-ribose pyrophosphatase
VAHDYEVRSSKNMFDGKVIKVRTDQVTMPGGNESQRDVVVHPGAVGVVAFDDQGRVMLIKQYRHPVAETLCGPARRRGGGSAGDGQARTR